MNNYHIAFETNTGLVLTRYVEGINDATIASPPAGVSLLSATESDAKQTESGGWKVISGLLVRPSPPTQADLDAASQVSLNATAKDALKQIDAHSVRSMREFLLAKFAADPLLPAELATHNSDAAIQRAKIR